MHCGKNVGSDPDAVWPQPSELQFRVVRAVGLGIAVLNGGPRRAKRRGGFGGFVPFFNSLP